MKTALAALGYSALAALPVYAMWNGMQGPAMQPAVGAAGIVSVGLALAGASSRHPVLTKRCWLICTLAALLTSAGVLLASGVDLGTALGLAIVVGPLSGLSGLLARNAVWALSPNLRPNT